MDLGDKLDAPVGEASVVHLDVVAMDKQFLVLEFRPLLTPVEQFGVGVPGPDLFAEAVFRNLSCRQEDVGVGVVLLRVDVDIRDHARDRRSWLCTNSRTSSMFCLRVSSAGEGKFDFSRELGVVASLDLLYFVPEGRAVG